MGTGFTIDTPLRVARYGVSSVISLVDDELIEQMRQFHSEQAGEPFEPIKRKEEDARARRITAYMNLVDRIVARQVRGLQASPFEEGGEITRYFEMLPDTPLKDAWRRMNETTDPDERRRLQDELRPQARPGAIDANIMTKLDRELFRDGEKLPSEQSDAMSALRGFANSSTASGMVLSAGLNQRLYAYIAKFDDFLPTADAPPRKKIILKVSDYRSAIVQGKFFAKRGLWVAEFRIESGLNCGGHTFAAAGALMGPILDEFRRERQTLVATLHEMYAKGLNGLGRPVPAEPLDVRVTVQGGVGTAAEHDFLLQYYEVDRVGWATPFLLVPEVTNIDDEHLKRLCAAGENDVYLSDSSPLGIPFWSLKTSESERVRLGRIAEGKPGSPCPKGFLVSNTEFTKLPICHASRAFQQRKLKQLEEQNLPPERAEFLRQYIVAKACICHDLAGGATVKNKIDPKATPSICCGPNIVNFSRIAGLEEMVGHIYGRLSLLTNPDRPHMFLRELKIYIDYFRKELDRYAMDLSTRTPKYFQEFRDNLHTGIAHYRGVAEEFIESNKDCFLRELERLQAELETLAPDAAIPTAVS
jgi:hypothetical protein